MTKSVEYIKQLNDIVDVLKKYVRNGGTSFEIIKDEFYIYNLQHIQCGKCGRWKFRKIFKSTYVKMVLIELEFEENINTCQILKYKCPG